MSAGTRPVWLDEEVEITALLNAVLDRFDRQPAEGRQRQVTLPVERYLPSLARTDTQADQSWALVRELERLGVLIVRTAKRNPFDPEWNGAKLAFAPVSDAVLRDWLRREWSEPGRQLWQRAVSSHADAFPGGSDALRKRRVVIRDRSADQVVAAFAGIASVQGPITLRQLSALAFWGDSKLLDDRGDLIAALFPGLEIRDRMLVVSVFLPENYGGVLFVENQDTYTAALGGYPADCSHLALVYAAGFRGAAARVRSFGGALLHYAGAGAVTQQTDFGRWWYEGGSAPGPCWFWGDLDFAGMQILKALRSRFEGLTAWRRGYEPMLEQLRVHGGYQPPSDEIRGQTDPGCTGCPLADTVLLPAIREYGQMDQERLSSALSTLPIAIRNEESQR
jgi:hypothetical protein